MTTHADKAPRVSQSRSGNGERGRGQGKSTTIREYLQAVRSWAREQGFEVSDRGRVSESFKEAYGQAN